MTGPVYVLALTLFELQPKRELWRGTQGVMITEGEGGAVRVRVRVRGTEGECRERVVIPQKEHQYTSCDESLDGIRSSMHLKLHQECVYIERCHVDAVKCTRSCKQSGNYRESRMYHEMLFRQINAMNGVGVLLCAVLLVSAEAFAPLRVREPRRYGADRSVLEMAKEAKHRLGTSHLHTYAHTCTFTYTHVSSCTLVHIHTHTHTNPNPNPNPNLTPPPLPLLLLFAMMMCQY